MHNSYYGRSSYDYDNRMDRRSRRSRSISRESSVPFWSPSHYYYRLSGDRYNDRYRRDNSVPFWSHSIYYNLLLEHRIRRLADLRANYHRKLGSSYNNSSYAVRRNYYVPYRPHLKFLSDDRIGGLQRLTSSHDRKLERRSRSMSVKRENRAKRESSVPLWSDSNFYSVKRRMHSAERLNMDSRVELDSANTNYHNLHASFLAQKLSHRNHLCDLQDTVVNQTVQFNRILRELEEYEYLKYKMKYFHLDPARSYYQPRYKYYVSQYLREPVKTVRRIEYYH